MAYKNILITTVWKGDSHVSQHFYPTTDYIPVEVRGMVILTIENKSGKIKYENKEGEDTEIETLDGYLSGNDDVFDFPEPVLPATINHMVKYTIEE